MIKSGGLILGVSLHRRGVTAFSKNTCQGFSLPQLCVSDESFTPASCHFFLMGDGRDAGWVQKRGSLVMSGTSPYLLVFLPFSV